MLSCYDLSDFSDWQLEVTCDYLIITWDIFIGFCELWIRYGFYAFSFFLFQKGKPFVFFFLPDKSRFLFHMLVRQIRALVNSLSYIKKAVVMDSFWGPYMHFTMLRFKFECFGPLDVWIYPLISNTNNWPFDFSCKVYLGATVPYGVSSC